MPADRSCACWPYILYCVTAGCQQEAIFSEVARGEKEENEKLDADRKVLESSVDPIKWKTELERVSSRLKAPQSIGGKEWREHIEQTHRNEETIQKVFSETKGQLQAMADDVSSALERLTSKEKYINHQFDTLRQEFAAVGGKMCSRAWVSVSASGWVLA